MAFAMDYGANLIYIGNIDNIGFFGGLIVAIPLQLLHTFLVNRADALRGRMEKAGLAVLNAIWIRER